MNPGFPPAATNAPAFPAPTAAPRARTHDESIALLLQIFREHSHFIITSHARPDGDAIGSALALAEVLHQLGCSTDIVLADSAPAIYRTLPNLDRIRFATSVDSALAAAGVDPQHSCLAPVILLECDSLERTGLTGLRGRFLINIDHHASGQNFASVNWIDPGACAVAAMVYRIAIAAGVTITPSMATCIYTAILSDTGMFTYPNTTPESFAIAHDLTLRGADPSLVARDLYFCSPLSKVRLLGLALNNLQLNENVAWSWVTRDHLERTHASAEDCEGIVGNLISIEGIDAAFFLRELADGSFRLSIRSKGEFNVARVAEAFGGGGHRNASGCTLAGPLQTAIDRLLLELTAAGRLRLQL
jgi:phosphoesterase RecJ-like protein